MRNKNLIGFILFYLTHATQAMDLLTVIENKIESITDPRLDPYNLDHKPEWNWPQKGTSSKGYNIYDRAGVLPFAWHNNTVYILLGLETAKDIWTDFTGSADTQDDISPAQTAAREFAEESNIIFYKRALSGAECA
jgi:hypothetical protein